MEYKGKLYGKVGNHYFPLQETTEDFEALEKQVAELSAPASVGTGRSAEEIETAAKGYADSIVIKGGGSALINCSDLHDEITKAYIVAAQNKTAGEKEG